VVGNKNKKRDRELEGTPRRGGLLWMAAIDLDSGAGEAGRSHRCDNAIFTAGVTKFLSRGYEVGIENQFVDTHDIEPDARCNSSATEELPIERHESDRANCGPGGRSRRGEKTRAGLRPSTHICDAHQLPSSGVRHRPVCIPRDDVLGGQCGLDLREWQRGGGN